MIGNRREEDQAEAEIHLRITKNFFYRISKNILSIG